MLICEWEFEISIEDLKSKRLYVLPNFTGILAELQGIQILSGIGHFSPALAIYLDFKKCIHISTQSSI
jgi:hypothetical protein